MGLRGLPKQLEYNGNHYDTTISKIEDVIASEEHVTVLLKAKIFDSPSTYEASPGLQRTRDPVVLQKLEYLELLQDDGKLKSLPNFYHRGVALNFATEDIGKILIALKSCRSLTVFTNLSCHDQQKRRNPDTTVHHIKQKQRIQNQKPGKQKTRDIHVYYTKW